MFSLCGPPGVRGAILTGYRTRSLDDDALLAHAAGVFDALYDAFSATATTA